MSGIKTRIAVAALAVGVAVPAVALGALPKRSSHYGGKKSVTSQPEGEANVSTNFDRNVFSIYFEWGCAGAPVAYESVDLYEQRRILKVVKRAGSRQGKFSFAGNVKNYLDGTFPRQAAPVAKMTLRGKFVTSGKATGTVQFVRPGCDSGKITWTARKTAY
jgi:hypothetical protein